MTETEPTGRPVLDAEHCAIARTLAVVGEKWTLLVLRDLFQGVRRFDDLHRHLGAPRAVLSGRLATLVDHGVVVRVPYRDAGSRERHEYVLTPAGLGLRPVLVALADWGEENLSPVDGAHLRLEHRDCGAKAHAVLRCEAGHELTGPRDVRARVVSTALV